MIQAFCAILPSVERSLSRTLGVPILPISLGAGRGSGGYSLCIWWYYFLEYQLNLSSGFGGGQKSLLFNSSAFNMPNIPTFTALVSSTSTPNAFYKSLPAVNDDVMPNQFSITPVQPGRSARSPERQQRQNKSSGVGVVMLEDEAAGAMQVDDEDRAQGREPSAPGEGGGCLGYSLFANHNEMLSSTNGGRPATGGGRKGLGFGVTSPTSDGERRMSNGIFRGRGDAEDVDMDTVLESPSKSQLSLLQIPTRRARTQSSRKSTAPAAALILTVSRKFTASSSGTGAGLSARVSTASRTQDKREKVTWWMVAAADTVTARKVRDEGNGQARARKEKESSADEENEGEEEEDRVALLSIYEGYEEDARASTAAPFDSNEDSGMETEMRKSSRISTAGAEGGSRWPTRKSVAGGMTTTGRKARS
ncbi:hypothetical protein GYMLUDRAFT_247656 [Collybiopsis luxurians FD-317 M1]|uniref:Uncharacterized protein n=1 Tax=Collybiopsis luxurians FD-317 M1 TaxID=944289 RepID=A0A0D0CMY6_9AGAR|nr:hypothetical protein GYMLUDRAFT_247656 [Collybiopsis luxurians FD-317 M1]